MTTDEETLDDKVEKAAFALLDRLASNLKIPQEDTAAFRAVSAYWAAKRKLKLGDDASTGDDFAGFKRDIEAASN